MSAALEESQENWQRDRKKARNIGTKRGREPETWASEIGREPEALAVRQEESQKH